MHVVASGQGWRRNCVSVWDVDKERVSVVENGTDLLDLLERDRLQSFQESQDPPGETGIVYLGGFYAWHGIDKLLLASADVVKRGAKISVTLIGSGQGEDEARTLVSELGLDELVTFTGKLKAADYAPLLASADIGVSPYCGWPEYSGLKIFDYKAAGLACVASGENGQPSTINHGKTGWIVPPCDVAALSEALFRLTQDVTMRRKLGQAARLDAEEHHAWRHTALQLEEIFKRWLPPAA